MREIRQLVTILLVVQIVVTLGISMQQVASCEPQVESFLLAPKVSYKLAASDPITIGLNSHFQDYASQGDGTEGARTSSRAIPSTSIARHTATVSV